MPQILVRPTGQIRPRLEVRLQSVVKLADIRRDKLRGSAQLYAGKFDRKLVTNGLTVKIKLYAVLFDNQKNTPFRRQYSTAGAGGQEKEDKMTIIDNDRPTRERVEQMHELIDELDAAQSAEVLALLTGMVMQAQISARQAS